MSRSSHKPFYHGAARALVVLSGLYLAAAAGAQDKQRFQETSNPRVPPRDILEPGLLTNPGERFLAIQPLLGAVGLAADAAVLEEHAARRSKSLGVSPERLLLWRDLFNNNGTLGLLELGSADLREYALDSTGTWQLAARVIDGREVQATALYVWELLDLGETEARFNVLLLEEGVFEKWLPLPPANGESYLIGSFGTVDMKLVEGDPSMGLAEGESAIHQVWNGEILGSNYPGTEELVAIQVESLIVKQGRKYNQAWATVHINEMMQRPSDYQTVQLTPTLGSDTSLYVSHRFDMSDDYDKTSADVPVRNLDRYWERAKKRPARLLAPQVLADPIKARSVIRGE